MRTSKELIEMDNISQIVIIDEAASKLAELMFITGLDLDTVLVMVKVIALKKAAILENEVGR